VAKIRINGEMFEFNRDHRPMAEMLELEEATGLAYGEWESGLNRGTAKSLAALAWLMWKRDGRDVSFADIVSGKTELNLGSLAIEDDDGEPDPMTAPAAKGASPTTGPSTSGRSAKSG
jgi:hypothetical protein